MILRESRQILTKQSDFPGFRSQQTNDDLEERRLPAPIAARDGECLALSDRKIDVFVYRRFAKPHADMPDLDQRVLIVAFALPDLVHSFHQFITTENNASKTITRKMLWTTLMVVCRPTSSTPPRI